MYLLSNQHLVYWTKLVFHHCTKPVFWSSWYNFNDAYNHGMQKNWNTWPNFRLTIVFRWKVLLACNLTEEWHIKRGKFFGEDLNQSSVNLALILFTFDFDFYRYVSKLLHVWCLIGLYEGFHYWLQLITMESYVKAIFNWIFFAFFVLKKIS